VTKRTFPGREFPAQLDEVKGLIADNAPLARERMRFLLSKDEEIEIVGEWPNGKAGALKGKKPPRPCAAFFRGFL
jgi:hypothetical protein